MTHSEKSSNTSQNKNVQLPLQGFRVPLAEQKPGWATLIEGMGNGRYRVHAMRIKK